MHLAGLEPERIGGMFGRPGIVQSCPQIARTRPLVCFLGIGIFAALAVLFIANIAGVLVDSSAAQSAIGALFDPPKRVRDLQMALLEDPVGIVVIVVTLLTPVFCCVQVDSIRRFVEMNETNLGDRPCPPIRTAAINALVTTANKRFSLIGTRSASLVILSISAAGTAILYDALAHDGLLKSWNSTSLSDARWRQAVFDGWWANISEQPVLAASLCLLGSYMFYFLIKQLLMGAVFAAFAHAAALAGFGVTPNLKYDSDGYSGLRSLRRFMQWTYGSSLAHFILTLGVFVVWLPASPATLFICIGIMITNAGVVIFPSRIAHRSAIWAKSEFVRHTFTTHSDAEKSRRIIEDIWALPNLPFRTRSTLTAVTVYLLFPFLLAVVSTFFKS